jgi:predicted amidohydrolase
MSGFAIASLQLELARGDNLASLRSEIESVVARFPWVRMAVLGELSAYGSGTDRAEPLAGPTEQDFCRIARKLRIWLVPGSFYVREGDSVYNHTPVINPAGETVARHRKLFPFLPYESGVAAGTECTVFDVPKVGRFGVSICYDMWFPESTRTLAAMGAEVILHPSMTNTIDRDVELAIARASAAINQCYFFDVNVAGRLGFGQSIVCGPGGETIHLAGHGREVFPVEVDLEYVRRVRQRGWHGIGQLLKSFRDRAMDFPACGDRKLRSEAFDSLGPLRMPERD